jgi:hypothetical protein
MFRYRVICLGPKREVIKGLNKEKFRAFVTS